MHTSEEYSDVFGLKRTLITKLFVVAHSQIVIFRHQVTILNNYAY
jgi:hypothetical protein